MKGEKEMANLYGVSAYQQTNSTWNNTRTNNTKTDRKNAEKTDVQKTETDSVKTTTFNPADTTSSLVPTTKNGYGTVIGDVELSDKAVWWRKQVLHMIWYLSVTPVQTSSVRSLANLF